MVSKQVIALQMVTGTIFRVIDNNNVKLGDSIKIVIPNTKDKTDNYGYIISEYNKLKDKFPNAEIIVILETTHWQTYLPMTELLTADIKKLIEKSDVCLKKGLL